MYITNYNDYKTIKKLSIIISDNYKTNEDIIKIKDMLVDNQLGEVDMKTNNSLSIKLNNIDKNIIINFPLDIHTNRSFTIGYEREEDNDESDNNENKGHIDKKYLDEVYNPTKRNGIRKMITLGGEIKKKTDDVEKPKDDDTDKRTDKEHFDDVWKKILERSYAEKGVIEHHLVINPKIENYDEDRLLELFRDFRIKFYRKYLGKHFNKMKEQQIEFFTAVEYGELYSLTGKKDTHLHIILKTTNQDMLNKFHISIKEQLEKHFGDRIDYQYKLIDKPNYRVNVYNYILKEGNECYTHNDFLYKKIREKSKKQKNRLFDLDNPLIHALLDK
ncbi:MAG: hypothetical protein J6Y03_03880 [Alphaproteobacteria bacterium]|nr:hypothetical protein [Alphaproteobacteria bacterium]